MTLSKTQKALELVASGMPIPVAAKTVGIAEGTLRIALWKRKGKELCPCCGQVVREGFELRSLGKSIKPIFLSYPTPASIKPDGNAVGGE